MTNSPLGKSINITTKDRLCFVVPTIFEYSAASLIVRLESFISRDLCNIWDGKLEYEEQRDQITDDKEKTGYRSYTTLVLATISR